MRKKILPLILIVLFFGLTQLLHSQKLSTTRSEKKRLLKKIKANQKDLESIENALNSFDEKTLRLFLKEYNLPVKNKTKSELIESILENIDIILTGSKKGKFKIPKEKSNKQGSKGKKRREEVDDLESKNTGGFLSYTAHRVLAVDKRDKKGYRRIYLFGKVVLKFHGKTMYADAVTIKIDEDDNPVEALAVGDVLLEDQSNNRFIGSKIYYFPQINRAKIFKSTAYNRPFYLTGQEAKQVGKSKYILYNGMMTSCNLIYPHYQLKYSKAWNYSKLYVWAEDVEYKVGNTTLLYTPFFFRSDVTTGVITAFGFERGIDWFIHNTVYYIPGKTIKETRGLVNKSSSGLSFKNDGVGMKYKLDYYQKMGVYLGYELLYKKGKNRIYFDSAVAYDRALKYVGGNQILTNFFDQDGDGIPEESNNLRWRIGIDGKFSLFSSKGFNSQLSLGFKNQGEPFFQSQFESRRKKDFNLWNLLGIERTGRDAEGASASRFGTITGQQIKFSLANKIGGLSVTLSGDLKYILQKDTTDPSNPPNNPFETDSYKNFKSLFIVPKIRLAYSNYIQILGKTKPKLEANKKKEEKKRQKEVDEFVREIKGSDSSYTAEKKIDTKKKEVQNLEEDVYLNPKVKRKNKLIVNMPLTYNLSLDFTETKSYNTTADNALASDIYNTTSTLTINTPFTLTYKFLVFNISNSETVRNLTQKTKAATSVQESTDRELTYGLWNTNLGSNLEFHFFDDYEYLELVLGSGVRYTKSDRFDQIRKEGSNFKNEAGRGETFGFDGSLTFLKTKFSIGLTDNLYISAANQELVNTGSTTKDAVLKSQRGNLVFTTRSKTFEFLTINNTFIRSRRTDQDVSNELGVSYRIIGRNHILGPIYLNSVSHKVAWYHDYQNSRGSRLSSTFNLDFSVGKNWNFIYQASSSNKQLYRYSSTQSSKYGEDSRDIFQDFLDSFNFFDKSKRERSFFNLESMTFKLRHDLHDWVLEFNVDLHLKQFRSGPYYFEPTLYFIIYLKDLPTFRYPKVKKTFTSR